MLINFILRIFHLKQRQRVRHLAGLVISQDMVIAGEAEIHERLASMRQYADSATGDPLHHQCSICSGIGRYIKYETIVMPLKEEEIVPF